MNVKCLLLSTAALLLPASAFAADAVVMVEPEPAEYVRVCEVYGKGYFYLPGTETCLKFGGYLRFRVQGNDQEYNSDVSGIDDYTIGTRMRARLEFDAREETELGMLRAKIRLEANNTFGDSAPYVIDEGYLQLGGLTAGYLDSVWTNNEGGIEDGLLVDESEFSAGDINTNRISYTYATDGFSGTLSLEDDGTGDWRPDVVGKLAYKADWGGAYLLGVYDEDAPQYANSRRGIDRSGALAIFGLSENDFTTDDAADGAFALKGGVLLKNLLVANSQFKVEGHYAFDPSVFARVGDVGRYSTRGTTDFNQTALGQINGGQMNFSSHWQAGAAYRQDFGKVFAIVNGIYGETFDLQAAAAGVNYGNIGAIDYYGVAGDLGYNFTSNFTAKVEVSYVDLDLPAAIDDFDQTRGFLELRRDF